MCPSLLRAGRPRSLIEYSTHLQYSTSADVPKLSAGEPPALPDNALPAETLTIKRHILARWFLNHTSANNAEGQRVLRGGCGKQRQGWRSAGVEPWMGSSTDEHRPRSTMRTTLNYSTLNINRCAQVFCGRAARAPRSSTAHTCNTQPQQMYPNLLRAGRTRSQLSNSSP